MKPVSAAEWITLQGDLPSRMDTISTDAAGVRTLTLMNLVLRDDYGLAHKRSIAVAPCLADSVEIPLALSFDSHTNAFPEDFYLRIGVRQVAFRAMITATSCRVRVLRRDQTGHEQCLAEHTGQGVIAVDLPFALRAGGSRCVVRIDATWDLILHTAAWTTSAPIHHRAIGVSITTYNKEPFVRANLQTILDSTPARAGLLEVLVVNNGRPIEDLPNAVNVVERKNIGGTGGFITAYSHFRDRDFKHFLVMDDDILIAPDFLERAFAISCFARNVHIGTIAEIMNSPDRLIKEQGARVSRSEFLGLDLHNRDMVLNGPDQPQLYTAHPADYSGWWGLLVDLSTPKRLPPAYFFIKRDDICFGIDSAHDGCDTIVFPNLHVTHSEVGSLGYFYYDVRNELILRASHAAELHLDPRYLLLFSKWCLLTLQPGFQKMLNLALRDFLRGPAYLKALAPSARLAKLRRIAPAPITRPTDAAVLSAEAGLQEERVFYFLLPRSYRRDRNPPVIEGNPAGMVGQRWAYFGAIPWTNMVYLRRRRLSSLLHYLQTLVLLRRLNRRYPALQELYAQTDAVPKT